MDNYFLLYPHLTDEQKRVMLLSSDDDAGFEIATHMAILNEHASDYQYYRKKIKERFEPASFAQERLYSSVVLNKQSWKILTLSTNAYY